MVVVGLSEWLSYCNHNGISFRICNVFILVRTVFDFQTLHGKDDDNAGALEKKRLIDAKDDEGKSYYFCDFLESLTNKNSVSNVEPQPVLVIFLGL